MDAEAFVKRTDLGVWDLCDGFGHPAIRVATT